MDHWVLEKSARWILPQLCKISGNGTHEQPWQLSLKTKSAHISPITQPIIASLNDDTNGCFQSNPHSPIDLAVILNNCHRLGVRHPAIAAVLAWDAPDTIALNALDQSLKRFTSVSLCAPLTRGSVSEPLPIAFRNASIPLSQTSGNLSSLPRVNRIPLSGIILGNDNAYAGFPFLDSEPPSATPYMAAIWNDRIVFSFPIVTILQQYQIPLSSIHVAAGKSITLGRSGMVIPIDAFGRLDFPLSDVPTHQTLPVENLIDAPNEELVSALNRPFILRDDRSAAEPATIQFSKTLASTTALIASNGYWAPPQTLHRLPIWKEYLFLISFSFLLGAIAQFGPKITLTIYLKLALILITLQIILIPFHCWLPLGAELLALLTAAIVAFAFFIKSLTVIDVDHIGPPDDFPVVPI